MENQSATHWQTRPTQEIMEIPRTHRGQAFWLPHELLAHGCGTTEREVPGLFQHFCKQSGPQNTQMPDPIKSWLKIQKVATLQGGVPGGHQ
jgi:hypothetical protein